MKDLHRASCAWRPRAGELLQVSERDDLNNPAAVFVDWQRSDAINMPKTFWLKSEEMPCCLRTQFGQAPHNYAARQHPGQTYRDTAQDGTCLIFVRAQ
jgi:hypothetical protein